VVVLDEINTYPPEVLKLLNPLLDGRRYINDPQFGKIKVHPSVLLVGLMNPQHYLGTTPLSPEVKSRARMMRDGYPAFKLADGTISSWEEAYLITRHMRRTLDMSKMDQNTFIAFWNATVNNIDTDAKPTTDMTKIFNDIA
jgi:MoxR-like ATPase